MDIIKQNCEDGILTLTLNRLEKLNALNQDVLTCLEEILTQVKNDNSVRGIIITGSGKAFCAGADIARLAECNAQTGYQFALKGQQVFRQLETLGKPSIAAINGYAFGGGCELAMAATIRIASATAIFGQPEVKLGVIPGYGGTQRLARLIGKGRALDLCLTGRSIDAKTALDWGLVSAVVDPSELLGSAREFMQTILSMAPLAISSVMEAIDHGFDMNLNDALHLEAVLFANTCASLDKTEGVSAFLEKRKAQFVGA